MSGISTHILDSSRGCPASGVAVTLEARAPDGAWKQLGAARTDADGRVKDLTNGAGASPGEHRLRFDVAPYFAAQNIQSFYRQIEVAFTVRTAGERLHVPLLLSPFGYSTYRGS